MIEFLNQGGFAGFVWGAFGMTFGLLLIEVMQLRAERRTILTRVGRLAGLRPGGPHGSASAITNRRAPDAVEQVPPPT